MLLWVLLLRLLAVVSCAEAAARLDVLHHAPAVGKQLGKHGSG